MDEGSEPMRQALAKRYLVNLDDLTPRVFYRLTDNWLELTVRFIVRDHGARDVKDAVARSVLSELEKANIGIASATFEIVGMPALTLNSAPR
jgi:small-conductance mechanosensitive channel